jgi:pyruvate dehydrogenase E2 component (dihydrolipoamide acetyltransferase)
MAFSVVMPALEMAQETGKLIAWRKKEGDPVAKGEPLLEIETDKAVVEVEAPADGLLAGISAAEGADIPVGQTIAWIVAPGEQPPVEAGPAAPGVRSSSLSHAEAPQAAASPATVTTAGSVKISPKARRLAKELGVDITNLHGSGPGGEILAADIQSAAAHTAAPEPAEEKTDRIEVLTSVGRIMAERTTQSWVSVPHFFVSRDMDASALEAYRERVPSRPRARRRETGSRRATGAGRKIRSRRRIRFE